VLSADLRLRELSASDLEQFEKLLILPSQDDDRPDAETGNSAELWATVQALLARYTLFFELHAPVREIHSSGLPAGAWSWAR